MTQPIIIFGAALKENGHPKQVLIARIQAAVKYGKYYNDPLYIVTGGNPKAGKTEAEVMRQLLIKFGVLPRDILLEDQAKNTIQSVFLCHKLLIQLGFKKDIHYIALVSNAYHLLRCRWLIFLMGWHSYKVPPPLMNASRSLLKCWRWRLREVPAILWDSFRFLYFIYFRKK